MNKNEVLDKIQLAVIYGSQASGKANEKSDLDIAVLLENKPDYNDFKTLFNYFSERFPDQQVDLRFLNQAPPLFRFQIFQNAKRILGSEKKFNKQKRLAYRMYVDDFLPYQEERKNFIIKKQEKLEAKLL